MEDEAKVVERPFITHFIWTIDVMLQWWREKHTQRSLGRGWCSLLPQKILHFLSWQKGTNTNNVGFVNGHIA